MAIIMYLFPFVYNMHLFKQDDSLGIAQLLTFLPLKSGGVYFSVRFSTFNVQHLRSTWKRPEEKGPSCHLITILMVGKS